MTGALIISNIALWMAVVVLSLVVLALVRQIGVLHERVAPVGALAGGRGPRPGEAAPVLHLSDWMGRPVTIGGARPDGRSTLLFFVSPTCPLCKMLLPVVDAVARAEGAQLVYASDGPRAEHESFTSALDLEARPYVLSAQLGLTYEVGKLPYAVLIDGAGVLRAKGLVNTREHVESLFEAMERGVGSVQEYLAHTRPSASGSEIRWPQDGTGMT